MNPLFLLNRLCRHEIMIGLMVDIALRYSMVLYIYVIDLF